MATNTQDYTETSDGGPQRLTDAAGDIAQQATSAAEQRASSTMTQVGDTLEQVAEAVRGAGDNLRPEQPQLAGFADTAADQVDRAASYLRDHDAGEVIGGVQDFARRQPVVVVGAGLAFGLLVGRALKSANGTSRLRYGASGDWRGSRYATAGSYGAGSYGAGSYQDSSYGTSSSYEAAGGYGTSEDYTGGAGASSTTTPEEER